MPKRPKHTLPDNAQLIAGTATGDPARLPVIFWTQPLAPGDELRLYLIPASPERRREVEAMLGRPHA